MAVWYVIGELGSLAEHTAPAELNANIRLEPGKHELTAEEIAAAKAIYRRHRQWLWPLSGWVFREAVGLCKAASCTAFVNRYKAFAPSPAARTRLKAKTRTTRRPWANFFLDF